MVARVKNLIGTAHLKSKYGSWKRHYTTAKKGGLPWKKCCVKGCKRQVAVGAHVQEVSSGGAAPTNRWIAPFCQKHNKMNTIMKTLLLKPGTRLVSVGPKRRIKKF